MPFKQITAFFLQGLHNRPSESLGVNVGNSKFFGIESYFIKVPRMFVTFRRCWSLYSLDFVQLPREIFTVFSPACLKLIVAFEHRTTQSVSHFIVAIVKAHNLGIVKTDMPLGNYLFTKHSHLAGAIYKFIIVSSNDSAFTSR